MSRVPQVLWIPSLVGAIGLVGCGETTESQDVLPMQATEQDCSSGGGWFFVRDEQGITVTLCPVLCSEHLGPAETAFVLERRWIIQL